MSGWAALGSLAGDVLNTGLSFYGAKELAKYQAKLNYKYAQKSSENSPTWNRTGLESAGYNPMLAVQNATSGANSSWTSSPSFDPHANLSSSVQSYLDSQRLQNETEQKDSTISMNKATERNQNADAANKEAQNPFISKQAKANIKQTDANTAQLNTQADHNRASIDYMDSQIELARKRLEQEKQLRQLEIEAHKRGQDLSFRSSIYGSDKAYNASTYGSNRNFEGVMYSSDTNRYNHNQDLILNYGKGSLPFGTSYFNPTYSYYGRNTVGYYDTDFEKYMRRKYRYNHR